MGGEARKHKSALGTQLEAAEKRITRLEEVIKALSMQTMQSFGSVYANEKSLDVCVDKLDMNDRAFRLFLLDIYGHLQHVTTLAGILTNDPGLDEKTKALVQSLDMVEMKTQAQEWVERVATRAFQLVEEEKKREVEENQEYRRKQQEEVEAAEKAKAEAALSEQVNAETALREAELKGRMTPAGGEGSAPPAGAYIFGGE